MREKAGFEHLQEPLHVLVEAELPFKTIDQQLQLACDIIETLLQPGRREGGRGLGMGISSGGVEEQGG